MSKKTSSTVTQLNDNTQTCIRILVKDKEQFVIYGLFNYDYAYQISHTHTHTEIIYLVTFVINTQVL